MITPNTSNAEFFLQNCIKNGLAHSFDTEKQKYIKPYPEVTGYLLSLFVSLNKYEIKQKEMALKLMKLQRKSGGWKSFFGDEVFVFDTAQIGKGLIDFYAKTNDIQIIEPLKSAINFILSMQTENGAFFPMYDEKYNEKCVKGQNWGNSFSVINCKVVEFLKSATTMNIIDCSKAIENACKWTLSQEQLLYTHPAAYALEGLLAGGYYNEVRDLLKTNFLNRIEDNGFISYAPYLDYAYVSGSVQIGILCYKVGFLEEAEKILLWATNVQLNHNSGGLFQYANKDSTINKKVHSEVNSWGTKYYIELSQLINK
jgi:hypothetical protein